ncbi:MAG: helix-turn-helix domain-containing protein [Bacteroidota bacterium]|nr:helix-turn-helix domain-containing protein [Bacteroidota bacterium]MDP4196900.1 helix-turn-helix domain-containing protein [Bacteroidota bacterium]
MENVILISGAELKELVRTAVQEGIENLKVIDDREKQTVKEDDAYIAITEVCKILKVSQPSVYNYRKKGIISFYRIGRRVFYKRSEILSSLKKVTMKYDF